MKLYQAINNVHLRQVWGQLAAEFAKDDEERIYRWLTRNVQNHLDDQLPHMHDPRIKNSHFDIGIKWSLLLTPRDQVLLPPNNMSRVKVLDMYSLPNDLVEVYNKGGLLYSWHLAPGELDEMRQRLSHLVEALQAVHGKKKHWDSITVVAANKIAEDWVAELNRRKLESGGETEVVWNYKLKVAEFKRPHGPDNPFGDALPDVESHLIQFHLLKDETAYQSEGQIMHHCVASYWSPRQSQRKIFSMRNATTNERLVTIEINDTTVTQARGLRNAAPTSEQQHILTRFYEAMKFSEPKFVGVAVPGVLANIANNVQLNLQPQINGLQLNVGRNGPSLFEYVTNLDVQMPMQYGHMREERPTVRLEGPATREGLAALQQLMRGG